MWKPNGEEQTESIQTVRTRGADTRMNVEAKADGDAVLVQNTVHSEG